MHSKVALNGQNLKKWCFWTKKHLIFCNKKHGYGTLKHANGTQYSGNWVDDLEEGFGKNYWPNGCFYEGTYRAGKKHGEGYIRFQNGDTYKGGFEKNLFSGYGEFTWASGKRYKGQWSNSKMNGHGTWEHDKGGKYEG